MTGMPANVLLCPRRRSIRDQAACTTRVWQVRQRPAAWRVVAPFDPGRRRHLQQDMRAAALAADRLDDRRARCSRLDRFGGRVDARGDGRSGHIREQAFDDDPGRQWPRRSICRRKIRRVVDRYDTAPLVRPSRRSTRSGTTTTTTSTTPSRSASCCCWPGGCARRAAASSR